MAPKNVLESIGQIGLCDRRLFMLELDQPVLPAFDLPSAHFSCLLVADFGAEVVGLVRSLMDRGAAYITAWGPGCAQIADTVYAEDRPVAWHVMASWHEDEPISEAVWFFLHNTYPDNAVFGSCGSALAVVVGHPARAAGVRKELFRVTKPFPLW